MTSTPHQGDSRRLKWLCIGFLLYFSLMLCGARYARTIPYQVVVVAGALNMAVILVFVFNIKRAYLRTKSLNPPRDIASSAVGSQSSAEADRRRLVVLWIGAGFCSVAFIKGLTLGIAYPSKAPRLISILAEIFSGLALATFLLAIRKIYKKQRSGAAGGTDERP